MSGINEKTFCVIDEKIFGQVEEERFDEFEEGALSWQRSNKRKYGKRLELLESRIELLTGKEKLLMTMYLKNGNSFYQMARLAGVNEVTIARRIYKIIKRLLDGEYITCLRNRDKFSDCEMTVAKDYLLTGLSMREIARHRRCSRYRVRQTLGKILAISKIEDKRI